MRETVPIAAAAAVIALILGAAGMYFLMPAADPDNSDKPGPIAREVEEPKSDPLEKPDNSAQGPSAQTENLNRLIKDATDRATRLESELGAAQQDKKTLEADRLRLESEVKAAREEIQALKDAAAGGPNTMEVDFGNWSEVEGLRKADWAELGKAYTGMNALLKDLAVARREGREPDPELQRKVSVFNNRLQDHLASVLGKLPSNTGRNGEFTHPANLLNILAGQLQVAGLPLSEAQIAELKKLGDEFDRRWDELQKSYDEKTWELQKHLDEAELKEWFKAAMFSLTTPEQKAAVLPPEVEDIVALDLYSAGLSLMFNLGPMPLHDPAELKPQLKERVTGRLGIDAAALDAQEYIFDDWANSLQALLTPQTVSETELVKVPDVISAGKAQLVALRALSDTVDEEAKRRFRADAKIAFPQVLKQE